MQTYACDGDSANLCFITEFSATEVKYYFAEEPAAGFDDSQDFLEQVTGSLTLLSTWSADTGLTTIEDECSAGQFLPCALDPQNTSITDTQLNSQATEVIFTDSGDASGFNNRQIDNLVEGWNWTT